MLDDIGEQIKYRYLWKLLELVTFLVLARNLGTEIFGVSFLVITMTYIGVGFLKATCKEDTADYKKRFYNTYLSINLVYGTILSILFFITSFFFGDELSLAARLGSVILLLSTISTVPDHYFSWKESMTRLYKPYFRSQLVASVVAISFSIYNPSVYSVLYSYIVYYLLKAILLWRRFPFVVKPIPDKKVLSDFYKEWGIRFPNMMIHTILNYGVLVITAVFFGIIPFSKMFIALLISFFLYENLTIYLNSVLLKKFMDLDFDVLKIDIIRYAEYMAFLIIPFTTTFLVLSTEFTNFVLGPQWELTGIFHILLIIGLLKGIFDITRIVFLWFKKAEIIQRLQIVEVSLFLIFSLIFYRLHIYSTIVSLFISSIVTIIFSILITIKYLRIDVLTMFKDYFYLFFSGLATLFTVGFIKEVMPVKSGFQLLIYFVLGIIIYIIIAFFLNREILQRSMRFMIKLFEDD